MKVIILEGVQGGGKTSLRRYLFDAYKSRLLVLDRFTPSNWVFNSIRGLDNTEEIQKFETKFNNEFKPLVFIFICDPEKSIQRVYDRDKESVDYETLDNERKQFRNYFGVSKYSNLYEINANMSINKVIKKVKGIIDEF